MQKTAEHAAISPPVSRDFNKALHKMPNCTPLSIGQVIWKNIGPQRLVLYQPSLIKTHVPNFAIRWT
jgi:hypothetical protein